MTDVNAAAVDIEQNPVGADVPDASRNDVRDAEELRALGRIAYAISQYRTYAEWEITRWERNYARLSESHHALLPGIPAKIAAAKHCVYQNHLFLKSLLTWVSRGDAAPEPLCFANNAAAAWAAEHGPAVHPSDTEKVRYVLKNLMRDWSAEGASDRADSYGVICTELKARLVSAESNNNKRNNGEAQQAKRLQTPPKAPRVLVPGCGLGRLCVELAALGFDVLGNEHSYYMLLASAFTLNGIERDEQFSIFPWALYNVNQLSTNDQLRPVIVPDRTAATILEEAARSGSNSSCDDEGREFRGSLAMAAGEFVEVFSGDETYAGAFDAVVTCFFIDTAHNVLEYLETVWKILTPRGIWVNLGPLQVRSYGHL